MRTSPLKRKTPLPKRTNPIRKQTPKQKRREDGLREIKRSRITAQLDFAGFAYCSECPAKFYTDETARAGLHLHHKTFRSHGGTDEDSNLALVCLKCHKRLHGLEVDEDDDAYWEALRLDAEDRGRWPSERNASRGLPCRRMEEGLMTVTHEQLRKRAVKWLTNSKGCSVVLSEIVTATSEIPDALGFKGHLSICVECKASRSDFLAQKNKVHVRCGRGVGKHRYILAPKGVVTAHDLEGSGYGLLEVSDGYGNIREVLPPVLRDSCRDDEITMLVSALRRVRVREFLCIVPQDTDAPHPAPTGG